MSRAPRLLAIVGILVAALLVNARPAHAASITNFYGFSGSITDAIAVDPFDPALGTLNSINISITGALTVVGTTGLNMVVVPPGVQAPQAYGFQVTVTQLFFGLANKYFEFEDPATFLFTGNATGVGEGFAFTTNYGYGFTFNTASDFVGFVIPTTSTTFGTLTPPLGGVSGLRSNFLDTIVPIDEIDFFQSWSSLNQSGTALPTVISTVNNTGLLQITYNYTPVPEPASWMLVVVGAAVLAARRLQRS